MDIQTGVSFEEFIQSTSVPVGSPDYKKLERLYQEIQIFRAFIDHSTRFHPIGEETRRLLKQHYNELPDTEDKDQRPVIDLQVDVDSGVVSFILEAQRRERILTRTFTALLRKYES